MNAVAAFRVDVVLLDIGLPGRNGYDVRRQIRKQANGQVLVIVALTVCAQQPRSARRLPARRNQPALTVSL